MIRPVVLILGNVTMVDPARFEVVTRINEVLAVTVVIWAEQFYYTAVENKLPGSALGTLKEFLLSIL